MTVGYGTKWVEPIVKYHDDECSQFRLDIPEEHNSESDVVDVCAEGFLVS